MTVNLLGSHNNRIQCLLADLEKTSHKIDEKYKLPTTSFQPTRVNGVKLRFKNCAILNFVGEGYNLTVSMIYEGELGNGDGPKRTSGDKKYYCLPEITNDYDTQFKPRTYKTFVNYDGVNVLVCRHGEAEHNGHYFYDRPVWYDTNLTGGPNSTSTGDPNSTSTGDPNSTSTGDPNYTPSVKKNDGYTQAANAATALAELYPELTLLQLLPSDLKRTYQTLKQIALILCAAFFQELEKKIIVEWYLLPCSHEVSSEKSNCDKKESKISTKGPNAFAFENTPLYSNLQANIHQSKMDVKKYTEFYPSGFRKGINLGRRKCRNTNMLEIASDILYRKFEEVAWIGDETDDPDELVKRINSWKKSSEQYSTQHSVQHITPVSTKPGLTNVSTKTNGLPHPHWRSGGKRLRLNATRKRRRFTTKHKRQRK